MPKAKKPKLFRPKGEDVVDYMLRKHERPKTYMSPFLRAGGLGMIYSTAGFGKTYLALSVAIAVASGKQMMTWTVPNTAKVLYIEGEMDDFDLDERLHLLCRGFQLDFHELKGQMQMLTSAMIGADGFPDFMKPEAREGVEWYIRRIGAKVVILDNLAALMLTGDENEAEAWTPMQNFLTRMRKQRVSIVMLHHASKTGSQRGTSKRIGILDWVLQLTRPHDYSEEDGARFEVRFEKARGIGRGRHTEPFEARLVDNLEGGAMWARSPIGGSLVMEVADLYNEGYTQREIAEEMEIALGRVNAYVKRGRDSDPQLIDEEMHDAARKERKGDR